MSETTQEQTTAETEPAAGTEGGRLNRALAFARRHPVLTVLGAAGTGLIGGLELATGVLIGGAVAAIARARGGRTVEAEVHEERERAARIMDQISPEVRKRARAVIQAVRGKLEPSPTAERGAPPVAPEQATPIG